MGKCIECGDIDQYQTGVYRCFRCIRQAENQKRDEARQAEDNRSFQDELLFIEQQKLHEQREFQQKILEQSVTAQQAFKIGYDRNFEKGDIGLGASGFEFKVISPYLDKQLQTAFFDGVNSKFLKISSSFDMQAIHSQIIWIGSDLKALITEAANTLITNAFKREFTVAGNMRSDKVKVYEIMTTSSFDGQSYCIDVLYIYFEIGFDSDCNFFISGIRETLLNNSFANDALHNSLNQIELLSSLNNREELIQIRKNDKIKNSRIAIPTYYPIGEILKWGVYAFALFVLYVGFKPVIFP